MPPGFIQQQTVFPTLEDIMNLARSIVNDMYPGLNNVNGRILTDDAPFTLPYVNSALRTIQRKLRIEGVTFPIKDNFILSNLTPVQKIDPGVQVYVSFNGYFDGTQMNSSPILPSDMVQPLTVKEQTVGSNLPFVEMREPPGGGITSDYQTSWLGWWEWRNYQLVMRGANVAKNLWLRYQSGQPPLNPLPNQFAQTTVNIIDCQEAMANDIARLYAQARGAADTKPLMEARDDAISDMAAEYIRRGQSVTYRREAYEDAGSGRPDASIMTIGGN